MATSCKMSYAHTADPVPLTLHQASANPRLCRRCLDTHRQVWASLLWGHCSFLLGPGAHKVLFVPSKSLFPHFCVSSVIKFHWPPKSNSLGVLSRFARSTGWEICCGSQNFLPVREFVWYNCSPVCGSSAWQLSGGIPGNLLQKGLCHTQDCCSQSSCPCSRPLLTHASQQTLKHSKAGLVQSLWEILVHTRFCLSPLIIYGRYGA